MADPARSSRSTPPPVPRWVKAFVLVAVVLAVLFILMLAGVFGEGHGPGRHSGGRSTTAPSDGPTSNRAGEAVDAGEATRTIRVTTLDSLTFQPATITVSSGETVTFAVTNSGRFVHEFTLGDPAMQQEHAQALAHIPAGMPHGFPNSITLQPGETKQLTLRFGDAGELQYACHVQRHYQAGMRGRITIT